MNHGSTITIETKLSFFLPPIPNSLFPNTLLELYQNICAYASIVLLLYSTNPYTIYSTLPNCLAYAVTYKLHRTRDFHHVGHIVLIGKAIERHLHQEDLNLPRVMSGRVFLDQYRVPAWLSNPCSNRHRRGRTDR